MVVKCTVVECEMTYDVIVKYGMRQELDVLRRISHLIQYGDVFGAPLLLDHRTTEIRYDDFNIVSQTTQ